MSNWIGFAVTEVYTLGLMAFIFRRQLRERKAGAWLKILLAMLAMYMGHVFYVLLSPVYFYRRFAFSTERLSLVPFRALDEWLANPFNFFGNVLLFMPLGFFEVLLHPGRSRKWQLGYTAATAVLVSVFVEIAQLFNYRVSDIDDVILNTIGAVLGALLCMLEQKAGFDRTRVGRVLLPAIPRSWKNHMLLNRFCVTLVVSMEVVLFTVNYIVTIPRTKVRENMAAQVVIAQPEMTAAPELTAAPDMTGAPAVTEAPEITTVPEITAAPAVTAAPEITAAPAAPAAPVYTAPALEAENVLLVRLADENGPQQVIYAVDSGVSIYPASTLKMLTALTALDAAAPEEKVRLGMEIYIPPLDASRASLEYGMTLTVQELLEGLLLPSGADAAYALAVYCGRKTAGNDRLDARKAVAVFVDEMNRKAEALGLHDTTARNVVGLDDREQKTTAEDILRLAQVFLDQPVLAGICGLARADIQSEEGRTIHLKNTNKMLFEGGEYYNSNVAGVKTGTTSRAGNCLVSVFTTAGGRYLCVVMNSSYYGKFTDTQALYDMVSGNNP